MHFGPDGKLYVAVGENANGANSQTLTNLLGKMLRINTDGTIPTDNPFFSTGHRRRTARSGRSACATRSRSRSSPAPAGCSSTTSARTPGRRSTTASPASNYGWPNTEGATTDPRVRRAALLLRPRHGPCLGCAITGGAFYNPADRAVPGRLRRRLLLRRLLRRLDPPARSEPTGDTSRPSRPASRSPVDLQVGPTAASTTWRAAPAATPASWSGSTTPAARRRRSPASRRARRCRSGSRPPSRVAASGTPPLSLPVAAQRRRHRRRDRRPATRSPPRPRPTTARSSGAVVTNSAGSATSNAATLTVVANRPPVATIVTPASGTLYTGGTTISYAGTGDRPRGRHPARARVHLAGRLPPRHAHASVHRAASAASTSGTFVIPNTGETSANVWYRIHLTVTDSKGLQATTFRDIHPRTVQVTLDQQPGRTRPHARRPADHGALHVYRCRGVPAIHRCSIAPDAGGDELRFQVVVRSACAVTHHDHTIQ